MEGFLNLIRLLWGLGFPSHPSNGECGLGSADVIYGCDARKNPHVMVGSHSMTVRNVMDAHVRSQRNWDVTPKLLHIPLMTHGSLAQQNNNLFRLGR